MRKPKQSKESYPARIHVPLTQDVHEKIAALARADHNRPIGVWVRIQLEDLLARAESESAKRKAS